MELLKKKCNSYHHPMTYRVIANCLKQQSIGWQQNMCDVQGQGRR